MQTPSAHSYLPPAIFLKLYPWREIARKEGHDKQNSHHPQFSVEDISNTRTYVGLNFADKHAHTRSTRGIRSDEASLTREDRRDQVN